MKLKIFLTDNINNNEKDFGKFIGFMFDGCHKFYLIKNKKEKKEMINECGYQEEDFFSIDKLPQMFKDSTCPLKFIQTYDFENIIPQTAMAFTICHYKEDNCIYITLLNEEE